MGKKDNNAAETSIAAQPTSKKIGFFSAMLIAMGSCIGAGIFFKAKGVLESSQGNIIFAIMAWILAAFAVIAMALALIEIASARNDNLSLIGWTKTFNSRVVYKASKNFMFYIYLPLTYFFMPFYVIMSLQDALDAFGVKNTILTGNAAGADWVIWFIISLVISAFFIFVSGISSRAGNIMNKIIMAFKFIPLMAVPIIAFVIVGINGANVQAGLPGTGTITGAAADLTSFGRISPFIGIFMAIGAIFFAYDGFYATAGIQSEMKEPKKTPMAILLGLGATTVIYLLIAISMSLTGDGGLFGLTDFLDSKGALWVFGVINLLIAIGVMGIINGFAMWAPRFTEDLIAEHELPLSHRYINKLNPNKPWVGIWYSVAISAPIVLIFTIIGAYGYAGVGAVQYGAYGKEMDGIYSFCDLMGTWTCVLAFIFIALPIYGGLRNRKSNFVTVEKNKNFVWAGWVSVIMIALPTIILVVDAFYNVFILTTWASTSEVIPGFTYDINELIPRIMKLVMLFVFGALTLAPTLIEDKMHIKKYGSIEAYEKSLGISPTFKQAEFKF